MTADDVKLVQKPKKQPTSWIGRMLGFESAKEKKKRLRKEARERREQRKKDIQAQREKDAAAASEQEPLIKSEAEKQKEKEEKEDDMKQMISMIKNLTGLWEDDPDDSDWLHIEKHDHNNPGKPESMGYICYSLQIWPKDKANTCPVGTGRSEPNLNPFCPPPVGRLKWSWNPFVLGTQLCGPKICFYFTCCLLCAAFCMLMIFCQPFLNLMINIIFFFG